MLPLLSLIRREFTAYFLSPIAYVVAFVLLLIVGVQFHGTLTLMTEMGSKGTEYPMQTLLGTVNFWLVFLLIPPILTMRLLAEERGTGTIEMLMTAPIREWQIVAGKYFACLLFYVCLWLPTLVYMPILTNLEFKGMTFGLDPWPVATTYLGLFLSGAMFLAIGLFMSSLVKSQLVAALISLIVSLVFVAAAFFKPSYDDFGAIQRLIYFVSVPEHFRINFSRGVLDSRNIILYVTVTFFCLFMTIRSLEARRK
jgi:ABC-2 type transport system permease protein